MPAHPNLLPCTRMDRAGGVPFLVMPNVEGDCWDREIKRGRLMGLNAMLDVAIQVARALAWLHAGGRVHGNIKPANVLLAATGVAKIWKHPQTGAKTRAYASPEQMEGHEPTPASDIWCWAVSVLHMFVGRVTWPTGPDAPEALRRYLRRGPERKGISLMPGTLADLLSRCLTSDPHRRPASMDDVVAALRTTIEHAAEGPSSTVEDAIARAAEGSPKPSPEGGEALIPDILEDFELPPAEDAGALQAEPVEPAPDRAEAEGALEAEPLELQLDEEDVLDAELLIDEASEQQSGEQQAEGRERPRRWTARRDSHDGAGPRPRGGGRRPYSS